MREITVTVGETSTLVDARWKLGRSTFEVGLLGQAGLDYATTDKKYTLRAIPGESSSGLEMMCLMHAGFRRIAPEMETGMDLDEPYLVALEMFELEKGKGS